MIGQTLSNFEITAKLGQGGMGEVYRATDTKLGREVAIKVLREGFAGDPDRLSRFFREARVLASLSHPNIATIYDFKTVAQTQFLIMELVEGESLAARIARGPIAADETLGLFLQIARGLEAAHAKGVVHRDLKPANMLVVEGQLKILDFGLARLLARHDPGEDFSRASTLSASLTAQGEPIGTAPYMSPEQARGGRVDTQTDIWAFGCCFFEALTGQRAFSGQTASDTMARVLEAEPDWEELRSVTQGRILELVVRCLQKKSRNRLHHIADARIEIQAAAADEALSESVPSGENGARGRRPLIVGGVLTGVAVVAAIAIAIAIAFRSTSKPEGRHPAAPRILSVVPPPNVRLWAGVVGSLDISPNGEHLVFVGQIGSGDLMLYHRSFGESESLPMPGSEGAQGPFFSADGRWVGFHARGQLKKVSVGGGHPAVVCGSLAFLGGTWLEDDTIVFTDARSLLRVPAAGGVPEVFATADLARGEHFRNPGALPGNRHVLVTAATDRAGQVVAVSLEDGTRTELVRGDYPYARYAPPRYLLHGDGASVFVTLFDAAQLRVVGSGIAVREGIATSPDGTGALFAVSSEGTLVYVPTLQDNSQRRYLVWRNRKGDVERLSASHAGSPLQGSLHRVPRLPLQLSRAAAATMSGSMT